MEQDQICSMLKHLYQCVPIRLELLSALDRVQTFKDAAKIVQQDAAVSFEVLRVVNSPFFGLVKKIKSIDHAISLIGVQKLRVLVVTSTLLNFEKEDVPELKELYEHSKEVAIVAKEVFRCLLSYSKDRNYLQGADDTSIASAALLHDFGKVPFVLRSIPNREMDLSHDYLAAALFECLSMPTEIIQACQYHHSFEDCLSPPVELLCTYIADSIVRNKEISEKAYLFADDIGVDLEEVVKYAIEKVQVESDV